MCNNNNKNNTNVTLRLKYFYDLYSIKSWADKFDLLFFSYYPIKSKLKHNESETQFFF